MRIKAYYFSCMKVEIRRFHCMAKERIVAYPAVLDDRYNNPQEYTVTFPDVGAAISQGKGIAEALYKGAEALGLTLYDKKELPQASDIEKVKEENPGTIVNYIFVDLEEAKKNVILPTVKKNTTLPGELAKRAEDAGINFSKCLREALEKELNK